MTVFHEDLPDALYFLKDGFEMVIGVGKNKIDGTSKSKGCFK